MSTPPSSPTVLTGQVSQRLSFQDVIDKNAEQWATLDTNKRREVADAFFDDQVIPSQADKWGNLDPIKQEETRRAFHQDYGIESLPDLRFDGMGPLQTQMSTMQAQLVNQARQHPIISDVLQTPQSYVQGGIEGLTARGARFNSPLPTGPISNFARSAGNTVGGIAGRLGLGYGLTPFLGPAGAGAASMGIYGGAENINTQIDDYHRDMKTINYPELGATTAINAVAGALPAAATGGLVKRALTGAAMNVPFGIGDMASQDYFEGRQMDPGSYAQQLVMDAITGGGLGALLGKRGGTPRRGSPISLKQVNEQPTVLQGRVEERVPISEGWKFKPTKTERQVLKRMDPTRRKRLDKAMTKRAEMEMQRANMRTSENPVSYEQMLQDMADEVLARPTEQRKVLIAQHRKKVKRVAKRQLRDPNAEPSPDEQFSMDLVDAIDNNITHRKEQASVKKKTQKAIEEAKGRTSKQVEKTEEEKRASELKALKEDIQARAKEQASTEKKVTDLQGKVGAARTKQAVSELAPDKQAQTARSKELKDLKEDIIRRSGERPLTKEEARFIKGKDGSENLTIIPKEVAEKAGLEPIAVRLQYGWHTVTTRKSRGIGFGLVHIEAGHGKDIREQGFKDAAEFVEYVLKNYNEVYTQEKGRPIFVVRNGRSKYAVVELSKGDDGFYSVTTAFPEKPQYVVDGIEGRKLVWSGRNSQSQVGQPRPSGSATVSSVQSSDQVGSGARARANQSKNNKSTTTPQASKQPIPQSRHEGQPQKAENPGKLTEVRQKTSSHETLDSLFEYEDAYNAYRELPKEQQQAVETINDQMKRGERLEIFGYDPKTGELTSGTGRKEGLGGDPNKLVTPLGWTYNANTGEIKFVALNNNFELRQYIIPKKPGSFGANAVLPSKQKGLVGGENNVYYKPGTFADPGEYVDHAIKKLPLVDIADLYDGKVTPQTEARLRNILNLKDSRVEVYNHVREIMTNQDAFKQYVLDHYLKDSPLVAHLENSTFSKPVDTAKAGALLSRNDIKIRRVIQMVAGCK